MTLDELSEIGKALYGPNWQSALARDLDVSDRTVRRWVALVSPIPQDLGGRLDALLEARAEQIRGLTLKLDEGRLFHLDTHAVFEFDAHARISIVAEGEASSGQLAALVKIAGVVARRNLRIAERLSYAWAPAGGVAETSKPFQSHDPAERLKRIEEIMVAAQAKATARPDAARSADVLYDDDGLPN